MLLSDADLDTLRRLIADDFASIGPKGFVLDKEQWIGRHVHVRCHAIETSEVSVRCYDRWLLAGIQFSPVAQE